MIRPMAMGMEVVPTLRRDSSSDTTRKKPADGDAEPHGEKNPEREVAVEKGELFFHRSHVFPIESL